MTNADSLSEDLGANPSDGLLLVVARHGATSWSKSGRHTSFTDLELEPDGREEARRLGARLESLRPAVVYSSPRKRALETCRLAGFTDPVVLEELTEWNYGAYEGRTTRDIHAERPNWDLFSDGCPGGESPEEIGERVDRALKLMTAGRSTDCIVVFAHGHVLRVLGARWIGLSASCGRHLLLDTGRLGELGTHRGTALLARWNV